MQIKAKLCGWQLLLFRRELLKQQYSGSWHQIEEQYEKMNLHWKEYKHIYKTQRYEISVSMIFYEDIETQSANWALLRRGCREGGWHRRRLWHEGGTKATNAGGRELITVDLVAVHSSLVTDSRPGYLLCSTSFYWLSLLVLNVAVLEWLLPHVNLLARHWSELWKLGNSQVK